MELKLFVFVALYLCSLPSVIRADITCSAYPLNPATRVNAIQSGIQFTDVASPTSTFGFGVCLSIGGGGNRVTNDSLGFSRAVGAQLDTGSTGVVVPRPTLPVGSYRPSGVCHVFDFDSSLNSYFGEMVFAHVRVFGADVVNDGRYLETNPMPILAVEYKCTGAACVPALAQYNESCSAIRAVIRSLPGWAATTINSTTALVGIGMNRGNVVEGYPIGPSPISRNPMLQLNLDPLREILPSHLFESLATVPMTSMCKSQLAADSHWSTSVRRCNEDPAEPFFRLNQRQLISYGYMLNATTLMPLYTYPKSFFSYQSPSPLQSPVFSCQSFPQLLPSSTPAAFKCFDSANLFQKVEVFSVNSSELSSSTTATWSGVGPLLADTGLAYFVYNTPSYPCLNSLTALRMTFPVPSPKSNQTNTPYSWTFDVDWRTASGSGTRVFYNTQKAQTTPPQLPPSQLRLWRFNTSMPCQDVHTLQTTGLMNSGRFLYNSFVLFADFYNGVQGYAAAPDFAAVFKGHYSTN